MTYGGTLIARLRGAFVGAVSASLAVAAHALGGGRPTEPSIVILLLGCVAIGAIVANIRAERHELLVLMGALVAAQPVGHTTLSLGADHVHAAAVTPGMLFAHVIAAAACAVLVRGGGRAWAFAVSALARIVPALFAALPVAVVAAARPQYVPRFARWVLVGARVGTRAPPEAA
ncbi:hypothetical protein [Aldersonia kunmingensis]|uniref:hypothetical protein n=1 Tax=Aldersonia kunmingensis TaxID=408066 RepID=UPI000A02F6D1|nr:hypothetical protein [Aldersonia kunmingensis]